MIIVILMMNASENIFTKKDFEKLLLKHQKDIYNFALKLCKNTIQAEDILQDVNIKALTKYDSYNHKDKFKNWILLITRNIFINNYRVNKVHNENRIDCDPFQLVNQNQCNFFTKESDHDIIHQELLENIKSEQDHLLILGFINGYSYKQMSEIFDLPEGTLKSRIFNARKNLKSKLINQI